MFDIMLKAAFALLFVTKATNFEQTQLEWGNLKSTTLEPAPYQLFGKNLN